MPSEFIALDEKEKEILFHLDFDARASFTSIGRKVGLSKQGAEYKVKRLASKGVIKGFYPVINVPKLGYFYCRVSFVLQHATEKIEQDIVDYLTQDPRFFWVFSTQGMYDYLVVMWAKSLSEFQEAIQDLLLEYGAYIKSKNESISTDVIHFQNRYMLGVSETKEIHLREDTNIVALNDLDKELLKVLCEDGRISLVKISERIKSPVSSVHQRLKRLERSGIIMGYRPIIDHNILGYTYYKLWISLHYGGFSRLDELYGYIRECPIVLYVVKGIGFPEDLDIEVMVRNNQELFSFIQSLRKRFPDLVSDYRSFMFMDTKKVRYLPF